MRRWTAIGLGLALAACARTEAPKPIPVEGDSISYETGPCFGRCPAYRVTVRADGTGTFVGKRFTAVTGEQAFTLTPQQYRAFAARLAPYRPSSGAVRYEPGKPGCEQAATDLPSVDVTWTRAVGDSQSLYFYFGCDMDKNQAMAEAIGNAPDALPIEGMIGARP